MTYSNPESNVDITKPLKSDDVRQILIDACDQLVNERGGVTAGDVIMRLVNHDRHDKEISGVDVKMVRELYNCTQDEMANAIEVTPATVKNWEQGISKPKGPNKILLEAMAVVAAKKAAAEEKSKPVKRKTASA